jgi:hypothetical protein
MDESAPRAQRLNEFWAPQFPRPRIFGALRTTLRARHLDPDPPIASSSGSRRRLPSVPGRGQLHPALLSLVRAPRLSLTDLLVVSFLSDANPQVQIFRCGADISIHPVFSLSLGFVCCAVESRLWCLLSNPKSVGMEPHSPRYACRLLVSCNKQQR